MALVAGNGTPGFSGDNGLATNAQLNYPNGVALDAAGDLYIADSGNHRVRKVSNGVISTVAGGGSVLGDNGPATAAQLYYPTGVAVDTAGNLYIADSVHYRIRKVSDGVIATVAGNGEYGYSGDNGPATSAQLATPTGVAVDTASNLYIADAYNNRIRKVSSGVIATVAGTATQGYSGDNGPASSAQLNNPTGVAVDAAGSLYIADSNNNRVRRVTGGLIATVAGGGNVLGDNGPATSAQLSDPYGVAVDASGNLYIGDNANGRVRKVANGVITTVAGGILLGNNSPAVGSQMIHPLGVAVDSAGNLYIADSDNNLVRKVAKGVMTTVAGNGTSGFSGDNGPATNAQLDLPQAVAVDSAGNLYIADGGNARVRKVSGGVITTVAGGGLSCCTLGDNGPATSANLTPQGVAVDSAGNLYIADSLNNRIRMVSNGLITTVAGSGDNSFGGDGGPATSIRAGLYNPEGVAVDAAGDLYIADTFNNEIRKVSNGIITTVAGRLTFGVGCGNGSATSAALFYPQAVAVDAAGNLYIADTDDNCIRKVSGGTITTLAGTGTQGFSGDNAPSILAQVDNPEGVAVDAAGNVYIADSYSDRVRILTPGTPLGITAGGIVPNDSTVSVIQSGSWISIFGTNLASKTSLWNGDFPQSLEGTSVTIDNKSAYMWYVSPQQINLQVPDDATTGTVEVAVTTASGTAYSTVTLATYAPSFSLLGDGIHVAGEIATPDGSGAYGGGTYDLVGPSNTFSYSTRPVKAGETLVLYGVGFGPTTPTVQAGQPYSGAARTNSPVTVTIGGVSASVSFAGVTEAGLYQLNLTVPANTGSGDQALQATVNGIRTPPGPVVTVQ